MLADAMDLGPLPLGPDMTIVQASQNHQLLLQSMELLAADPRVDLSGVTECDSSGVQLLVALRSSLAERGQALQVHGMPAVVRDALDVYGLLPLFAGEPAEAAA